MRSERKGRWAERREEGERQSGKSLEPVRHLELRQVTCCLSSSQCSPVGAGPGERERVQGGGRKGAGGLFRPPIQPACPLGSSKEATFPTLPAKSSAIILRRALMESRPPLLGLVIGARALSPHWLRVQPLSLREPSTFMKSRPSLPGIGHR